MSTNFYSMSGEHIGKRHGIGANEVAWTWAMDPDQFTKENLELAEAHHCPSCECVEKGYVALDEYDQSYTWTEMLQVVNGCAEHTTGMVGVVFC